MKTRMMAIAQKEFFHILRDPRTLAIIFIMPAVMLLLFGYALKTEMQEVRLGIIDVDGSTASRDLRSHFEGNRFFSVFPANKTEMNARFQEREADAFLFIPARFYNDLAKGRPVSLQLIVDASNSNNAQFVQQYVTKVVSRFQSEMFPQAAAPFEIRLRNWYNPQGKSAYFIVPGILAIVLVMICALLTSIAIAREKETGTMEQLLVSAVRSHEIIFGKVIPYIFLAIFDAVFVVAISVFVFGVPFVGSIALLSVLTLLYIFCSLSLGLLISTAASSQQNAMMIALSATMLPSMFLSGFFFPLDSMPKILQYFSYVIPARYYLQIVRGIMLKGCSFNELASAVLPLAIMTALLIILSIRKFNDRLG